MRISDWSSDVCSSDLKIAQTINANSRPAISGARRLFQLSADLPLDEALRVGREIGFASFSDPDTAEGIVAYAEGRAAAFRTQISELSPHSATSASTPAWAAAATAIAAPPHAQTAPRRTAERRLTNERDREC